jgi:hypothetical protein
VDAVGPDGAIQIEEVEGTQASHAYIDGVRWDAGYASEALLGASGEAVIGGQRRLLEVVESERGALGERAGRALGWK